MKDQPHAHGGDKEADDARRCVVEPATSYDVVR